MKVAVASKNPVKIEAVRKAVAAMYPNRHNIEVAGFSVPSEVPEQPMTDEEARLGAYNRVRNLGLLQPTADLVVAMEGGVHDMADIHGKMSLRGFAWVVARDNHDHWGEARSAFFQLPEVVAKRVRAGEELGPVDDEIFGKANTKQESGSTGLLTHDVVMREDLYFTPVALALAPLLNAELYARQE